MPANISCELNRRLTLNLLTWKVWRVPNNARKWQMRINSAYNT